MDETSNLHVWCWTLMKLLDWISAVCVDFDSVWTWDLWLWTSCVWLWDPDSNLWYTPCGNKTWLVVWDPLLSVLRRRFTWTPQLLTIRFFVGVLGECIPKLLVLASALVGSWAVETPVTPIFSAWTLPLDLLSLPLAAFSSEWRHPFWCTGFGLDSVVSFFMILAFRGETALFTCTAFCDKWWGFWPATGCSSVISATFSFRSFGDVFKSFSFLTAGCVSPNHNK